MRSFKVTLDMIEEDIAIMLVRNEESVRIVIPLFLCPPKAKKEISCTLLLPKMSRKQRIRRKE